MLTQNFCIFLEYEICKALELSDDNQLKGFWCDGILLSEPESSYSQKSVNDTRQVILKAFIGKNGQTEYELTLKFGKKALSRYARNLTIDVCVPNPEDQSRFEIDVERKQMVIQLD